MGGWEDSLIGCLGSMTIHHAPLSRLGMKRKEMGGGGNFVLMSYGRYRGKMVLPILNALTS